MRKNVLFSWILFVGCLIWFTITIDRMVEFIAGLSAMAAGVLTLFVIIWNVYSKECDAKNTKKEI